ncbi:type VI secretion system Vgr family protein [Robbsia sp. KACC 23696]|uniref:type VI secretion system Vgr family protein n=1 Tax=Robbsia sp. KACC 23696 TaxID=3149231 RepID=UPI00325B902A
MALGDAISALTSGTLQAQRLLKLDTGLSNVSLVPVRAIGESRVGRQFSFTIDAVSTASDIALKQLIAQPVTLWVQQADQTYLPHNGYVHQARRLGSDGMQTTYQLSFSSWLNFLKFRKDARIWQNRTTDQIITDVFNEHPQGRGAFQFSLSNTLPSRSFCVQYEDDWTFVHRLMEQEGLFGYFTQAADGKSHTLIVTDNLYAFPQISSDSIDFYRAGAGSEANALTQWSGERTLQSAQLTTRTYDYKSPSTGFAKGTDTPTMPNQGNLPSQTEVYEYTGPYTYNVQDRGNSLSKIRMEEWESRAKRFFGSGGVRGVDAGQWFTLQDHDVHMNGGAQERQFAVLDARWVIENNIAVSVDATDFPFSLKQEVSAIRAAQEAQSGEVHTLGSAASGLLSRVTGSGTSSSPTSSGDGFYLVEIEAQRRTVPFRSPFDHQKPKMQMQTATVVGPSGQEVYTDSLNRIKVRMHWDRLNPGDENASCWMRVAQSDSGGKYGGVHTPRIGEEVIVSWLDGDCDRPLVTGRLYNGGTTPNWHSNGILSGFKSKEYGGSGYNQLVMDDATGQNRAQLYSSTANTGLHLGYLIDHVNNSRGAYQGTGFDLVSNAYGALRATQGLYVSTYPTTAQPMDASEARKQLALSESVMNGMSKLATTAQAEGLDAGQEALKRFAAATQRSVEGASASGGNTAGGGTGSANQFNEPVVLMASPGGIGLSTQESVHLVADKQVNGVSGGNTTLAIGKSLLASVKETISLFAQNSGIKAFAAKGRVEIQAQSNSIDMIARKAVMVISATDVVEIGAKKDILLTSGGAYIRIANGNIEIHTPGQVDVKASAHDFSGPTNMHYPFTALPLTKDQQRYSNLLDLSGLDAIDDRSVHEWAHASYYIVDDTGTTLACGETDQYGVGSRFFTASEQPVHAWVEGDEWLVSEEIQLDAIDPSEESV